MRKLTILTTFSATLLCVPVVMAGWHGCFDECVDRNFDFSSAYDNHGVEWAEEQEDYWMDRCNDICVAKWRAINENAKNAPASKPTDKAATSGAREQGILGTGSSNKESVVSGVGASHCITLVEGDRIVNYQPQRHLKNSCGFSVTGVFWSYGTGIYKPLTSSRISGIGLDPYEVDSWGVSVPHPDDKIYGHPFRGWKWVACRGRNEDVDIKVISYAEEKFTCVEKPKS